MLVYRVEDFNGTGVYSLGVGFTWKDWTEHPCPSNDRMLKDWFGSVDNFARYYFGFNTLRQFADWFVPEEWHLFTEYNKKEIDPCRHAGLSIYDCPDDAVKVGDKQTVFIKELSQRLMIVQFSDLEISHVYGTKELLPAVHDKYVIPA